MDNVDKKEKNWTRVVFQKRNWTRVISLSLLGQNTKLVGQESGSLIEEREPIIRQSCLPAEEARRRKIGGRKTMESPKKIAHEIGGVKRDALRFGLNGVKSDIVGSHPLESSYESVIFPPLNRVYRIKSVCLSGD